MICENIILAVIVVLLRMVDDEILQHSFIECDSMKVDNLTL